MRAAALVLVLGFATVAQAANDGGPLRDRRWGASPADNGIAYVPFDIASSAPNDFANVAALQANGMLLLGGQASVSSTASDLALARLLPASGMLDLGFGSSGRLRLATAFGNGFSDIAVNASGAIVYTNMLSTSTFAIGRLLANGTPDIGFDGDGRRALAASAFLPLGSYLFVPKFIAQPDGKTVVIATVAREVPDLQVRVVATRLNADGSTDTSFGGQGTGYASFAPDNGGTSVAQAAAVVRLADGRFLVGGYAYRIGGSGYDMMTLRLSADGVLDTTYGNGGYAFVAFDEGGALNDLLAALTVDPAGRAIVIGDIDNLSNRPRMAVARLTPAGQLDTGFGNGGRVLIEIRAGAAWEYARAVAALPDGRVLVAGTSALCACGGQGDAGTLTQLSASGQVNRHFGVNGTERIGSDPGPDAQILPVAQMIVSGDYAYLAGWANSPLGVSNNREFATARLIVPLFKGGFEVAAPAPL